MSETRFELWYGAEGVSITEYDDSGGEPAVEQEWWWTWDELFVQLTGRAQHGPEIHSQN
jgi:hypothetical protein